MRILECAAVAAALILSGAVHAQTSSPAPPPPAAAGPSPTLEMMRGPDERVADFNRFRDKVEAGPTRSTRPVPASPKDITQGSEVRDSKGVVIGSIEKVDAEFAVVASPGGRIEVEFASFAKNNKGLLINMPKAKFDAIVAGAGKQDN